VDRQRLKPRTEADETPAHYNELGVRKYDLPALIRRLRNHFRGPSTTNPKLVSYLAAGGIQGLRPLRYEKRVARNRFIALVIILFLVLLGIISCYVRPSSSSGGDVGIDPERGFRFMKTKPQSLLTLPLDTADGTFIAHYSPRGLAALEFPPSRRPENVKTVPAAIRRWHQITRTALRAILAGRNPRSLCPPLDLSGNGTAFSAPGMNQLGKLRSEKKRAVSANWPGALANGRGRAVAGGAVRGQSRAGPGAVSPGAGVRWRAGRFFRRTQMEASAAGPRTSLTLALRLSSGRTRGFSVCFNSRLRLACVAYGKPVFLTYPGHA
jgi:hypothetical protein